MNMRTEPILLPRIVAVVLAAALGALGVEVAEDDFLGGISLAEVLTAVAIAGVAYIGEGLQRRAFTDSPATVERQLTEYAADHQPDPTAP